MQAQLNSFAEILTSSLDNYTAHCWDQKKIPSLGELVSVIDRDTNQHILGCVVQIERGTTEQGRMPFAYGKTIDELLQEQPQIFAFLTTIITVTILGYENQNTGGIVYALPAQPSSLHSFVHFCSSTFENKFFSNPLFLPLLFKKTTIEIDEILIGIIRRLISQNPEFNQRSFQELYHMFSFLIGSDYRRLKLFLRRIEQMFE